MVKKKKPKKSIEEWEAELRELSINKKWEELLNRAYRCINEWPERNCGYFFCGNAKIEFALYEEAITAFDKAIELDPENKDPLENRAVTFGMLEVLKTSRKIEETYREQLESVTDPALITRFYEHEIGQSEKRLYGDGEGNSEGEDIGEDGEKRSNHFNHKPYQSCTYKKFVYPPWFAALGLLLIAYICGLFELAPFEWLCWFAIINILFLSLAITVKILCARNLVWVKEYELASKSLRIIVFLLWLGVMGFFGLLNYLDTNTTMQEFTQLSNILPVTTSLVCLVTCLFLHVHNLRRRYEQEIVRLHSLMRERNVILLWTAQSNDNKVTNKSKMAPKILKQLATNSTADLSMRMLNPRHERNDPNDDAMLSRLARILKLIKKHTP